MQKTVDFLTHFFIPHHKNNYHAKALQLGFLTNCLIFAFALTFIFRNIGTVSGNVLGFATDISINKLFALTNEERVKNSLSQLTYNEKLSAAAQKKAEDMFKKDYWAHFAPDGTAPWEFILATGYKYEYAGENLAKNFLFSKNVVDAWMKSPSHRENLLRSEYSEIGFAVVNGILNGEETTLVVQFFSKPLSGNLASSIPQNNTLKPQVASEFTKPEVKTVKTPKVNLTRLFVNFNMLFIFIFILTLGLDFYFMHKMKIFRIKGKTIAHMIFLTFILIGIFYITKGSII